MGVAPLTKEGTSMPRALVLSAAISFKELLSSCKGRDKFLAVIQFSCAVYRECMKDYLEANRLREWPKSATHAKSIYSSLKSSRKMFKLFKFISELSALSNSCKKVSVQSVKDLLGINVVKSGYHVLSFFYYIIDNVLWVESIGVAGLSLKGGIERWKWAKNLISLFRAALKITLAVKQNAKAGSNLEAHIQALTRLPVSSRNQVVSQLLKLRFQQRLRLIEVGTNALRTISIVKSMEMPGHLLFSSIFVCFCRLTGAGLSAMKIYFMRLEK